MIVGFSVWYVGTFVVEVGYCVIIVGLSEGEIDGVKDGLFDG